MARGGSTIRGYKLIMGNVRFAKIGEAKYHISKAGRKTIRLYLDGEIVRTMLPNDFENIYLINGKDGKMSVCAPVPLLQIPKTYDKS